MSAEWLLVCRKDLLVEVRTKTLVRQVLPFVVGNVFIFAFALDTDSPTLRSVSGGVFWSALFFAAVLLVSHNAALERQHRISDGLRLTNLSPLSIYVGKTVAVCLQLVAVAATLVVAIGVLYGTSISDVAAVALSVLLGVVAMSARGVTFGAIAATVRGRQTVLALLYLPVMAPVLLCGSRVVSIAVGRSVGSTWPWIGLLTVFALATVGLGSLTYRPLLEHT